MLMVGSFSALTVVHMGVLASACSARVLVCGVAPNSSQRKEVQKLMSIVGCKSKTPILSSVWLCLLYYAWVLIHTWQSECILPVS